jgi:hypothetical protein
VTELTDDAAAGMITAGEEDPATASTLTSSQTVVNEEKNAIRTELSSKSVQQKRRRSKVYWLSNADGQPPSFTPRLIVRRLTAKSMKDGFRGWMRFLERTRADGTRR